MEKKTKRSKEDTKKPKKVKEDKKKSTKKTKGDTKKTKETKEKKPKKPKKDEVKKEATSEEPKKKEDPPPAKEKEADAGETNKHVEAAQKWIKTNKNSQSVAFVKHNAAKHQIRFKIGDEELVFDVNYPMEAEDVWVTLHNQLSHSADLTS